jgi:hypothetical protein
VSLHLLTMGMNKCERAGRRWQRLAYVPEAMLEANVGWRTRRRRGRLAEAGGGGTCGVACPGPHIRPEKIGYRAAVNFPLMTCARLLREMEKKNKGARSQGRPKKGGSRARLPKDDAPEALGPWDQQDCNRDQDARRDTRRRAPGRDEGRTGPAPEISGGSSKSRPRRGSSRQRCRSRSATGCTIADGIAASPS